MEEELKQLELAENFEAAAELRQKIRDMKREERKRIIRKQKEDENMAQKEKDERLFNKVVYFQFLFFSLFCLEKTTR